MTKKEQRRLRTDIKRKVRDMMKRDIKWAMEVIESGRVEQAGLLDDHSRNSENFITPKNLLCAMYQDLASSRQYGPTKGDRRHTKIISNYYLYV